MDGISSAFTAAMPFQGTRGIATGIAAVCLLLVGAACLYYALRCLRKGSFQDFLPPSHPKDKPGHRRPRNGGQR